MAGNSLDGLMALSFCDCFAPCSYVGPTAPAEILTKMLRFARSPLGRILPNGDLQEIFEGDQRRSRSFVRNLPRRSTRSSGERLGRCRVWRPWPSVLNQQPSIALCHSRHGFCKIPHIARHCQHEWNNPPKSAISWEVVLDRASFPPLRRRRHLSSTAVAQSPSSTQGFTQEV